jgi:uncharacterized protein
LPCRAQSGFAVGAQSGFALPGGERVMSNFIFADPWTLLAVTCAVILVGFSKGGMAGVGVLSVPVMALVMSPVQAAGILLPILLVSDAISLWTWWGYWDRRTMILTLPGAMIGIGIGWLTAAHVSDDVVRLILGIIGVVFVLRWMTMRKSRRNAGQDHNAAKATVWAGLSGYTSFVAHAGGVPYQVYTMPLNMDPKVLTGTSVAFFAILNAVKLVPYFALGQFDGTNLATSAILSPLVVVATLAGAALIKRMRAEIYYPLTYGLILLVSVKLIWDGIAGLAAG